MIPVIVLVDQKMDDLLEEIMLRENLSKSDLIKKYLFLGLSKSNDSESDKPFFSKF